MLFLTLTISPRDRFLALLFTSAAWGYSESFAAKEKLSCVSQIFKNIPRQN